MSFSMPVMRLPQEDRLVYEIARERDCCYAESGKCSFESVPSREWPGIPPRFSADCVCQFLKLKRASGSITLLPKDPLLSIFCL
jgi:hypothetical protein